MAEQRPKEGTPGYRQFLQRMQEYKCKFYYALTELLKRYTMGKDGFPFEIDLANNEDWIWFRWSYPGMNDQVKYPIYRKYRVPRHQMILWFLIYVEIESHAQQEPYNDRLYCSLNEADLGQRIQDQPRRGPIIPGSVDWAADRNVIRAQYSALTPEAQQFTDFINNFYNTLRIPKERLPEVLPEFERFYLPPSFPDPTRYAPAVLPPHKKTDKIERPFTGHESFEKFRVENAKFRERFFRSLAEIIHNIPNEEKEGYLTNGDFIWFRFWYKGIVSWVFRDNANYRIYRVPNHPMVRQFLVYVEDELRDTIYDQLYCSRYRADLDTRHESSSGEPTRNTIHPESQPEDVHLDRARIRQNYTQEFLDFIDYYYRPYTLRMYVENALEAFEAVFPQQGQFLENVGAGPVAGPVAGEEGVEDGGDDEPELPPKKKQRVVALKQVTVPSFSDMGTASGLGSARMPVPHPAIQWLVEDPNEPTVPPSPDMGTASGLRSSPEHPPHRPAYSPAHSPRLSPQRAALESGHESIRLTIPNLSGGIDVMPIAGAGSSTQHGYIPISSSRIPSPKLPPHGTKRALGHSPAGSPGHSPAGSLPHSPALSPRPSPPRGLLESGIGSSRIPFSDQRSHSPIGNPVADMGMASGLESARMPPSPRRSPPRSPTPSPLPSPILSPLRMPGSRLTTRPAMQWLKVDPSEAAVAPLPDMGTASGLGSSPKHTLHSPTRSPIHISAREIANDVEIAGEDGDNDDDGTEPHSPARSIVIRPGQSLLLRPSHKRARRIAPRPRQSLLSSPRRSPAHSLGHSPAGSHGLSPARSPRPSPPRGPMESRHESTRLTIPNLSGGIDVMPIAGADSSTQLGYVPVGSSRIPSPDHTARSPGQFLVRGPLPSQLSSPIQSPTLVGQQEIVDLGPEEVQQYFDVEGIVSDIREEVDPEGFNPAENVQLSPRLQQYLSSGNTTPLGSITPVASPAASPGHDLSPDPALSPGENQLVDEVLAEVNDLSDEEDVYGFGGIFDDQQ